MTPVRCRLCGHATFPKGGRGQAWTYRCSEGCQCTPTYCRPISGGTASRKETTSMSNPQSADDFLMGGGGAPTAKFPAPGARVEGFIAENPTVQQQREPKDNSLKFWPDGNAMMQLVVTLQTTLRDPGINDDDGKRRLFVKGQMKSAIQTAVKAAGGSGLEVGGYLAVTYTHDGQKSNPMLSAPKQFRAEYSTPAAEEFQRPDPAAAYSLPPVPQQQATAPAPAVPGLTPQQVAAAQSDPAMAALLAQLQAQQAGAVPAGQEPPF